MKLSDKGSISQIPILIRHYIGLIPSSINPFFGIIKNNDKSIIHAFDAWDIDKQQQYVYHLIKQNVVYAFSTIPFYYDFYTRNNFKPSDLKCFNDIQLIPIISKRILLEYPLEKRANKINGFQKVNTGGSSGTTLAFYRDSLSKKYHEGIHMTTIWEKLGYNYSDLKLIMSGQNNVKDGVDFCFHSNSIRLDMYRDFSQLSAKLKTIAKRTPVSFLHGYPSLFYEFALYCDEHDNELRDILRKTIKGAFLGSEYPHNIYRDKIERTFNIDTVNWYGHTEGAVLAYEKNEKFRYCPFHTYGFAEISNEGHLIGSTYFNQASPFIRYDTEDSISDPEINNGFLTSFGIKDGRNGEYIIDKNNKKISLTGLIFGRHHKLFDHCSHIQICQKEKGKAIVLYLQKDSGNDVDPQILFDSSNIEVGFSFKRIHIPIKTKSGKLNLLIKPEQLID